MPYNSMNQSRVKARERSEKYKYNITLSSGIVRDWSIEMFFIFNWLVIFYPAHLFTVWKENR